MRQNAKIWRNYTRDLTGMPHEHEMPAPVTTSIFLHFATERERLERRWRVVASDAASLRARVMMGIAGRWPGVETGGGGDAVIEALWHAARPSEAMLIFTVSRRVST